MKKLLYLLCCIVWILLCAVCVQAASLGDVDGSGSLDASDARLALRAAVGLEPELAPGTEGYAAADADLSGVLTAADARDILRAAVGLTDLSLRLPESARLSKEALTERVNEAALDVVVYTSDSSVNQLCGALVGENGVAVVHSSGLRRAIMIGVMEHPEYSVDSVLAVDPQTDLALLGISGAPHVSVNPEWYGVGDPVYSTDYLHALYEMEIVDLSADAPREGLPDGLLCVKKISAPGYYYDVEGYPLLDRFGRVIGYFVAESSSLADGPQFAYALPLARLKDMDVSSPRTVEEFSRDEWHVSIDCPVEEVSIVRNGLAVIRLEVRRPLRESIWVVNEHKDLFTCVLTDQYNGLFSFVIFAKEPCENVPVTIRMKGRYEIASVTLRVSVTEDGYVNMVGAPFFPDPGVIWGFLPEECRVYENWEQIHLLFNKRRTELSDEELFYSFAGVLEQMGYEFVRAVYGGSENSYIFRQEEFGVTVTYRDLARQVRIAVVLDPEDSAAP